ncbi:hypothetical protein QYM36_001377 [Artemia franciscana]|uniref:Uncharacterized protein n=1 Tax=Artemia franciscana TaxID=6661 RepID=A0AA88LB38_ARTSF|nr:hypothetical protein QYM36_001377 [Artemia franciscana]
MYQLYDWRTSFLQPLPLYCCWSVMVDKKYISRCKTLKSVGLMKSMPNYLAVINLATAGLNGALLGSDEEEIVILVFVVVDVAAKQVVGLKEFFVKPRAADINENVLSEQARDELGLQEDQVRSGKPLESAIEEQHCWCDQQCWEEVSKSIKEVSVERERGIKAINFRSRRRRSFAATNSIKIIILSTEQYSIIQFRDSTTQFGLFFPDTQTRAHDKSYFLLMLTSVGWLVGFD